MTTETKVIYEREDKKGERTTETKANDNREDKKG